MRIKIDVTKIEVLIVILMSCHLSLTAQDDVDLKHEMRLLARPFPDSIVLRWAPTSYQLWLNGNQYGYHITRTMLIKDGKNTKGKTIRLTRKPLKPIPLAEWETLVDRDDYAGVAAQAIYGDGFEVEASEGETSMMDIINKSTEQENRYGFALFAADQSPEVARYSGLWLTDEKVRKGEKYLYKVFPAQVAEGIIPDTAVFFTGVDEYMALPAPLNVKAEEADKMITLTWDKVYQSDLYNSFWIERSNNNGKSFRRLNDVPLVNTTPVGRDEANFHFYVDTLPNNETKYLYRIIGISVFGELSPPSRNVQAKGVYKISSVPQLTAKPGPEGQTVQLSWQFPNEKGEKVDGYRIYRSEKFESAYSLLADNISAVSTSYTDKKPLSTAYYRIQAFNHGFDGAKSIPRMIQLVDSIPPIAPTGLRAEADTSGLVRLSWTANAESDIFGYRVYRANSSREEFSQITSEAIKGNAYADTINLKTLTKEVFYKLVAVDKRQNKSPFSEILKVERPDIVPPAAPVIRKAQSTDAGILIQWNTSPSIDVHKQVVYRNLKGSYEWVVVSSLAPDSTQVIDIPPAAGKVYRYLLMAVDKAGNESKPAKPVAVKYTVPVKKDIWITPKVRHNKKKGTVELSWEKPDGEVKEFRVYQKKEGESWELVKVIRALNNVYSDKFIKEVNYKVLCKF